MLYDSELWLRFTIDGDLYCSVFGNGITSRSRDGSKLCLVSEDGAENVFDSPVAARDFLGVGDCLAGMLFTPEDVDVFRQHLTISAFCTGPYHFPCRFTLSFTTPNS